MRFLIRLFLGAALALAAACGGSKGSSSSTGGAGTSTGAAASSTGGNPTGGGSSTGAAPNGSSFAEAIPIQVTSGNPVASGTLNPAGTSAVYFSFTGTQGESLWINAQSTPTAAPFTPGYLDTVVSLYDAQQTLIAENNDPVDGSSWNALLLTVLPAAGTYYVRVVDCTGWERKTTCPSAAIVHDTFALSLETVAAGAPALTTETAEPNDTTGTAPILMTSAAGSAVASGAFSAANDVNGFIASYSPGSGSGRSMVYLLAVPAGATGSGSTAPVASVSVESSNKTTVYYQYDPGTQQRLWVPQTFADPGLVILDGPAQAPGANPFYFLVHGLTTRPYYSAGNSTLAQEDDLTPEADGMTYYVNADITPPGGAFFGVTTLAATTPVTFACYGVQEGSGVTLEAKLVDVSGQVIAGADYTESPTKVAGGTNLMIPAGKFYLEVIAVSQSATVMGSSYDCEIVVGG